VDHIQNGYYEMLQGHDGTLTRFRELQLCSLNHLDNVRLNMPKYRILANRVNAAANVNTLDTA
jgi:hypothetical protein